MTTLEPPDVAALEPLLHRDPLADPAPAGPTPAELARLEPPPGATAPLLAELRWWRALSRGRAGDWSAVSALADQGLGEPFSARESLRLAALHCLSGSVEEAEHVLSQAVQLHGDAALPAEVARWCERQGLAEAAARLRAGAAGPPPP